MISSLVFKLTLFGNQNQNGETKTSKTLTVIVCYFVLDLFNYKTLQQ